MIPSRSILGLVVGCSLVGVTAAQPAPSTVLDAPTAADPANSNPIVTGPGAPSPSSSGVTPAPRRPRAISAEIAAQLTAAAPKYAPPPPKPPPSEDDVDLRDIDKPRNGIIRLPAMIVHEKPPPVLNERTVSTKKGLTDIAMKRYLTETDKALNSFRIPFFSPLSSAGGTATEDRALTMYAEDERLKHMADLTDSARMVGASDKEAGKYVKRQVDETFMRDGDFDWKPAGR